MVDPTGTHTSLCFCGHCRNISGFRTRLYERPPSTRQALPEQKVHDTRTSGSTFQIGVYSLQSVHSSVFGVSLFKFSKNKYNKNNTPRLILWQIVSISVCLALGQFTEKRNWAIFSGSFGGSATYILNFSKLYSRFPYNLHLLWRNWLTMRSWQVVTSRGDFDQVEPKNTDTLFWSIVDYCIIHVLF